MTPTTSLLLGAALGVMHGVAGVWIARLAMNVTGAQSTVVILGGTGLRMFAVLAVVMLLMLFTAVQTGPFIAGLGVTFVIGLSVEVLLLLRRPSAASPRA